MNKQKTNRAASALAIAPLDASAFPQTAKFMDWFRAEQAKGLIDIKFFAGNVDGATLEDFFAEANAAMESDTIVDKEVF
jgi:hypothetical protein